MRASAFSIQLPDWTTSFHARPGEVFTTLASRMQLAIELARQNVQHRTGGPFGAAVFEQESGQVVALGVNLVVDQHCSLAHAEMVALALAQQHLGTHSLAPEQTGRVHQLVTSVAPCAMCLGAIPWSGIRSLICGAPEQDAREIGFDEGDKPAAWIEMLSKRGIEVETGVLRDQARCVLQDYRTQGGSIY
jgi:tRNA(Arg) A34 adenosine deaminase TadA